MGACLIFSFQVYSIFTWLPWFWGPDYVGSIGWWGSNFEEEEEVEEEEEKEEKEEAVTMTAASDGEWQWQTGNTGYWSASENVH